MGVYPLKHVWSSIIWILTFFLNSNLGIKIFIYRLWNSMSWLSEFLYAYNFYYIHNCVKITHFEKYSTCTKSHNPFFMFRKLTINLWRSRNICVNTRMKSIRAESARFSFILFLQFKWDFTLPRSISVPKLLFQFCLILILPKHCPAMLA